MIWKLLQSTFTYKKGGDKKRRKESRTQECPTWGPKHQLLSQFSLPTGVLSVEEWGCHHDSKVVQCPKSLSCLPANTIATHSLTNSGWNHSSPACWSEAEGVQSLAQGHFDTYPGGAKDQTRNLPFSKGLLSTEPLPSAAPWIKVIFKFGVLLGGTNYVNLNLFAPQIIY